MGMRWAILIDAVIFTVFAVVGVCIVKYVSNKKWGYTEEREQELERKWEQDNENKE